LIVESLLKKGGVWISPEHLASLADCTQIIEARIEDRRNDVGKNAYNEKRSEPVPLERGRCMSGFLP